MKIDKTGRDTLKSYFVKNAVPTAGNFEELIAAALNQRDDGLAKPPGEPLSVQADGDDASQKKLINFYRNFNDAGPVWTLALNPRSDARDPQTARPGLGVTDASGVPRLFIDEATGNLGLGTVQPQARLEVAGTAKVVVNHNSQRDAGSGLSFGGSLVLKGNAPQLDFIDTEHNDWAIHVNENRMYFIRQPWNFTDLVLDGNGSVGMGCFDPRAKLEVRGGAFMPSSGSDGNSGIRFPPDPGGGSGDSAYLRYYPRSGEACTLELGISNDPDDHIALMASGNVGVGNRAPAFKLDVAGSIGAGNSDLYFTKTDHVHSGIGNAVGFAAIENSAAPFNCLMILGRNTAASGVARRVGVWDFLTVNGTFINASDARSKHDIRAMPYGLDALRRLKPVSFRWNDMAAERPTLGLIAQEVQQVVDEAVFSEDPSRPDAKLGIAYNSLIPVLIQAVQELAARLDTLDGHGPQAATVPSAA